MKHRDLDSRDCLPVSVNDLREALEAKRDELIRNYIRLEEIVVKKVPDLVDQVVAADVRGLARAQMEREGFILDQVLDALGRIANGLYGICLHCGEPVCSKGLAALPWVTLCQRCQKAMDSQRAQKHSEVFRIA